MNIQIKAKKYEKSLFKIIYIAKKPILQLSIYTWIFFIVKFLGIVITGHNFKRIAETETDFIVSKFLRIFCIFKNLKDTQNILFINYNVLCFIIYSFLLVPFGLLYVIYKNKSKSESQYEFTKLQKFIIKASGVILALSALLFQHFMEILYFIFLHFYISEKAPSSLTEITSYDGIPIEIFNNFNQFGNTLVLGKYFYLIANFMFIILYNVFLYFYIQFLNEPFFNSQSQIKLVQDSYFMMLLILCFNFQGFHYYELAYIGEPRNIVKIIKISLAMLFSLLALFRLYQAYNFNVFLIKIFIFLLFTVFISSVIDIFIFTISTTSYSVNKQALSLLLTILFSILGIIIFLYYKRKGLISELETNLFNKSKHAKSDSCFMLVELLESCIDKSSNFLVLFDIFNKHKAKCANENCSCNKFKFNQFQKNIIQGRYLNSLVEEEKMRKFNKLYQDIIILCEHEITNTLHMINKHRDISNDSILILYFDFMFYIRKNFNFAFYIIEEYSSVIKNIPFYYKYYFFTYKYKLCKENFEKIKSRPSSTCNYFLEFLDYHKTIEQLLKYIVKSCSDFHTLMRYKNDFEDNKVIYEENVDSLVDKIYILSNIEQLFLAGKKLNHHLKHISDILRKNFSNYKLKHPEICFLLTHFYKLTNKETPINLIDTFNVMIEFSDVQRSYTIYDDDPMTYHVLINIQKKNIFKIKYISQRLSELLNYDRKELIDHDMHIFLPEEFADEHKLLINKLIFHESKQTFTKETFLVTKENYCFASKVKVGFIPTLMENILMLIDVKPIDLERNDTISSYEFITDLEGGIICYSKNFETKFNFSNEMVTKLKLNLGSLFDINFDQIKTKFTSDIRNIGKNEMNNYIYNYTKLFSYNSLDDCLMHKNSKANHRNSILKLKPDNRGKCIEIKKRKDKLIPGLVKLIKLIQESEFNPTWIQRIKEIEKSIHRYSSMHLIHDFSSITNKKKSSTDYFFIEIYFEHIGNVPFYKIRIFDHFFKKGNVTKNSPKNTIIEVSESSNNLTSRRHLFGHYTESKIVASRSSLQNFRLEEESINNNNNSNASIRHSYNDVIDVNVNLNANLNVNLNANLNANLSTNNINNTNLFNESNTNLIPCNKFNLTKSKEEDEFVETTNIYVYEDKQLIRKKFKMNQIELTKKRRTRNVYLFIIVCMLCIIISLSVNSFFDKNEIFTNSQNLINIYFYTLKTKAALSFSALLALLECESLDGINPHELYHTGHNVDYIADISSDLLKYNYDMNKYFHTIDQSSISEIYSVYFKQTFDVKLLHSDWSIKYRHNTTIHDELIYYNYYIRSLDNFEGECRLQEKFFNNEQNKFLPDKKEVTFAESVIYYIFENLLPKHIRMFDSISYLADQQARIYFQDSRTKLITMDAIMIFSVTVIITIFFLFVRNYKQKITHTLFRILKNKEKEKENTFQKKLHRFLAILNDFDEQSFISYEELLKDTENTAVENLKRAFTLNQNEMLSYKTSSMSVSKLKSKKIKTIKNDSLPLDLPEIKIRMIRFCYYFLTFSCIIYLIITILNINYIDVGFSHLILGSQMCANFKGRISKFAQLALYYKTSIIKNDPNYMTFSLQNSQLRDYSNFFNVSVDFTTDSLYSTLKQSEFSINYFNLIKNIENIEIFMSTEEDFSILTNVRQFENQVNTKQICLYYAEFMKTKNENVISQYEGFEMMNSSVQQCKLMGPEISTNGLNTGIKILLNTMRNSYLDFAAKSPIHKEEIISFFNDPTTYETFYGIQTVLKFFFDEYVSKINEDMDSIFSTIIKFEFLFSAAILLFNLGFFLIMTFFFVWKFESYYEVLGSTLKKLDKVME